MREGQCDVLQPDVIRKKLGQSVFAANIIFHETLSSTNTLAKNLGARGAPEGTLVLTEKQTAGRGRMGRRWLSPANANLLFSVLLRPVLEAEQVFSLTMVFALAIIDGLKKISGVSPVIKWPNDLYLAGGKLAGILTEFSVVGRSVEYVVFGLGLNVNWNPAEKEGTGYPATSILAEAGKRVSRTDLLVEILKRFEAYSGEAVSGRLGGFYKRWNERSMLLGKGVEIETANGRISGKASRIDRKGAIIILDEHGHEQRVLSGDVSVLDHTGHGSRLNASS